jgi:hypothetical protein
MKLLIQETITGIHFDSFMLDEEAKLQDREDWEYISETLDRFSVHHDIEYRDDAWYFTLYSQKVTLDEVQMNELFYDILFNALDYNLEYAPLGGRGCGFALEMTAKKS